MLNNEYYVWGAGTYGGRLIDFMENDITFKAVIDNDLTKQGKLFHGLSVVSYNEAKCNLPESKIVVSLAQPYPILHFLQTEGYTQNTDFFTLYDFLPRIYWEKDKLVALYLNLSATTMCTMKCHGCQNYIHLAANYENASPMNMINDIDLVFSHVDSFLNICICCGESLLNDELSEICCYVNKRYADRYLTVSVPSNGSLIPKDEDMRRFSESNTIFSISDYPENEETRREFIEKCKQFNVSWFLNTTGERENWHDFGDPRTVSETDPDKLRNRYNECWVPGVGLHDGWLYLCAAQTWAQTVVGAGTREIGDAFDLRQPKTKSTREEVFRLISRQPELGYISHCMRCNGAIPVKARK